MSVNQKMYRITKTQQEILKNLKIIFPNRSIEYNEKTGYIRHERDYNGTTIITIIGRRGGRKIITR
jgi:hypothetical protein